MTAEHDRSLSPEDEALMERRIDQGVWNVSMGQAAIRGSFEDANAPSVTIETKRKPRHSHRGGRSLPEISGRDVARDIANQAAATHPVCPEEQAAINERGRALLEQERKKLRLNNLIRRVDERTEAYDDPDYPEIAEREALLEMNARMRHLKEERESSSDVK